MSEAPVSSLGAKAAYGAGPWECWPREGTDWAVAAHRAVAWSTVSGPEVEVGGHPRCALAVNTGH